MGWWVCGAVSGQGTWASREQNSTIYMGMSKAQWQKLGELETCKGDYSTFDLRAHALESSHFISP